MGSLTTNAARRIAVIGGGPLGISTTKYLLAEKCFEQIDIYEQQETVEGAWYYTSPSANEITEVPQTNPHKPNPIPDWRETGHGRLQPSFITPMYDHLDTNLPKHLMQFSDASFPRETQLFPSRQTVSQYIKDYAKDVRHMIKFATQVVDLKLQPSSSADSWTLTSKNLHSGAVASATYDAIAVCSGHYAVPYVPPQSGIEEWNAAYPGSMIHSKYYRSPELFKDKKVLVVGNAASGLDIANQIATMSKQPLLVSQRSAPSPTMAEQKDDRKVIVPEIARFFEPTQEHRAVKFVDGNVEKDIDFILFATGYLYNFPFLRNSQLGIISSGMRIEQLYLHLFHRKHPSIAFFGMPIRIVPFPICEAQAAVAARIWSGRLTLPSQTEMAEWERATIAEMGDGRRFHYLDYPRDYHYIRNLYDWASQAGQDIGKLPEKWDSWQAWMRQHVPAMKRAFAEHGEARHAVTTFEQLGFDYDRWKQIRE